MSASTPSAAASSHLPASSPPTNLAATVNNGQVNLTWSDSNTAETGVVVQRSTDGGATFTDYASLDAFTQSFTDTGVTAGGSYTYRVYAVNDTSTSSPSSTTSATLAPAAATSLVAAAASATRINLTWADVSGETSFRIERSTDGINFASVGTVNANVLSYADTTVSASATYYYRVIAINSGGTAPASNIASATTPAAPVATLNAPSNLAASWQKNGRIRLTWADTNTAESGYRIEVSTDGVNYSAVANVSVNTTSYQTGRVAGGRTYWYRVKAYNATTESAYSNVAQTAAGAAAHGATLALGSAAGTTTAAPTSKHLAWSLRVFNFVSKLPSRR